MIYIYKHDLGRKDISNKQRFLPFGNNRAELIYPNKNVNAYDLTIT